MIGWKGPFARKILKKIWMAAPICIFWTIWREGNRVVFEDVVPSAIRMKNSFVLALWSWAKTDPNVQALDVVGFLVSVQGLV